MGLISDRIAQVVNDKLADLYADILAAEQPDKWFYDVITETDDPDVEVIIGDDAEVVDDNLLGGLQTYNIMRDVMVGFQAHVASLGPYTMAQYFAARNWRMHRFAADRMWSDSRLATLNRAYVCPETSTLLRYIQGGAVTDTGDIPATAGPARCQTNAAVKGAAQWTPDVYAVLETPATTLNGAISDAVLELELTDATDFVVGGGFLMIGDEAMIYTGIVGTTVTLASRGDYGTAAAAHLSGAVIYHGMTAQPVIEANAQVGTLNDLFLDRLTDTSLAGQTTIDATGILAAGLLAGMTFIIKDHSCPQALTADCNISATVQVANADAFRAGDYVMLHDDTPTDEWNRILSIDQFTSTITLTAATAGNFATADEAWIALAWNAMNNAGVLAWNGANVTLADSTGFPATGTILIEDEELTYNANVANVLTIAAHGVNGTTAVDHNDLLPVVLVQEGTFPGHNEVHTAAAVGANTITTDDDLLQTYEDAAFVTILFRELISAVDGAGGNAGDDITIYAQPDRLIAKSG